MNKPHQLWTKISTSRYYDLFILSARILLAYTFIHYGYSKLTDGQFGVSEEALETPLKDLTLYQVGWYLFDQPPFQYIVGVSQIIVGLLLLINRTVLLGVIGFIPIAATIIIIDLTIMTPMMALSFFFRLSTYILLAMLIFFNHKQSAKAVVQATFNPDSIDLKFKWWQFLLIPIIIIGIELSSALLSAPIKYTLY